MERRNMPTAAVSAQFPAQNLQRISFGDSGNQFATSREVDKARQLFGMPVVSTRLLFVAILRPRKLVD